MPDLSTPSEMLPVAVRAYLDVGTTRSDGDGRLDRRFQIPDAGPSDWMLVFDTETTTDAAQQLRFGTYQVRKDGRLKEAGFFYDPESLTPAERALLARHASESGQELMTVAEFIERIFYGVGYELGATIVGFNLPFDLSRLAIHHASARGKTMHGGFSFQLSPNKAHPPVQVKDLSRRAALIRFTAPRRQRTPRGQRRRKLRVPVRRGYFVDLKSIAAALTARTFSLANLAEFLGLSAGKLHTDAHGDRLTEDYLRYAVRDTEVTWQCYRKLRERYLQHGLTRTPVHRILSEAGLGKAYLREMGILPWREVQPDVPPDIIGQIMSSYYGGRAEVRIRREITEVAYCDFLSMYPTVCTLMGLWRFVIARNMTWHDATYDARELLASVTLEQLQTPNLWQALTLLVQVTPDENLFPVRTRYGNDTHYTIGLNFLSSQTPLWFTLADCIAAKLLTGKVPYAVRAIRVEPGLVQPELLPISIAGNPNYRIDPTQDDFYRRLIDLRREVKAQRVEAEGAARDQKETEQLALKILANATSYGIFVELNVDESPKGEVACYGPDGECLRGHVPKIEMPGRYFHPLLGTLITGAARLMLALAERLVADAGLEWVFCDTDSLAIAKPDAMKEADFQAKVAAIRKWFVPLNPYAAMGSLLKLEAANFAFDRPSQRESLFAFAVSAKRYALFNLDTEGRPIFRKASAHGLGHLIAPYQHAEITDAENLPAPVVDLAELGVERWQHDVWYQVVSAALDGHPKQVVTRGLPNLDQPAVSRYAATTPDLLRWFQHYNKRKPYRKQVRPFGFLLAFQARGVTGPQNVDSAHASTGKKHALSRRARQLAHAPLDAPRAVAPFDRNLQRAAKHCFDRNSGKPVPTPRLKSYRQALLRYHLHPETKFRGGRYTDHGHTYRRHIEAVAVELIGKEANRWEEQFYLGDDPEAPSEYGLLPADRERMMTVVRKAAASCGMQAISRQARLSRRHLHDIVTGKKEPSDAVLMKLANATRDLAGTRPQVGDVLAAVRGRCREFGCRAFALHAGLDDGNLGRILAGTRRPSASTLSKLVRALRDKSAAATHEGQHNDGMDR